MPKDKPEVVVHIVLNSYEIANLFAALEMVPDTGDWYQQIINKIDDGMREQGVNPVEFYYPVVPGMTTKAVKKHLENLEK